LAGTAFISTDDRIGSGAARHIEAHAVERRDFLAQHRAIRFGVGEALQLLLLALMEHADALRGDLQRVALRFRNGGQRGLQFRFGDVEGGHAGGAAVRNAVELIGVLDHGFIAARFAPRAMIPVTAFSMASVGARLEREQRVERLFGNRLAVESSLRDLDRWWLACCAGLLDCWLR
jgi:hypothetical protein